MQLTDKLTLIKLTVVKELKGRDLTMQQDPMIPDLCESKSRIHSRSA